MKLKNIIPAVASCAMFFTAAGMSAQVPNLNGSNPGIAIAGSQNINQIPEKAKAFIEKHFKNVGIKTCERYFAKGKYEVELTDGIDLEFDMEGNLVEIDAPDNTLLPVTVVKEVMPAKAYERLEKDGYSAMVESIELNNGKVYEVELNLAGPDTYIFDIDGVFIAIED